MQPASPQPRAPVPAVAPASPPPPPPARFPQHALAQHAHHAALARDGGDGGGGGSGGGELRAEVRALARTRALSSPERDRARQGLYSAGFQAAAARERAAFRAAKERERLQTTWSRERDPATGRRLRGCEHYARSCKVRAPCCGVWVVCRRCHDVPCVLADHAIDRFAISEVLCMFCWTVQPPAARCRVPKCRARFARYYCAPCRFWDDAPGKRIYHCDRCRLCRVGTDEPSFHCDRCNACVSADAAGESHKCVAGALDGDCPVCSEPLFTSTTPVVFIRCGHALHQHCFEQYTAHNFVCPLCSKALTDMGGYYKEIERAVANDILPEEVRAKRVEILCHDCDRRSVAQFAFVYHRCARCSGFNTRVVAEREDGEAVRLLPVTARAGRAAGEE